ncbi:MAG: DUF3644 domain-containing protein [Candidatus Dormibacteraceae bacterium]
MSRARWNQIVESSRAEALNAVEFYNRPASRRPLEAYLVHMHIAWLYLLQAEFLRDKVRYYYRDPRKPRLYVQVDGERKSWDLERCVRERWPSDQEAVRQNLELTIKLRNRIEHRYEAGLIVASAGFCQALLLNYEEELLEQFGSRYSIADSVHIPVALSTFTREGVARLVAAQQRLPKKLQDFFVTYRSSLDPSLVLDRHFEFRVEIIQKSAPKSEADLAISFVREEDLTDNERQAYETLEKTGRVILREKARPVVNLDHLRPTAVCQQVEAEIPFRFRASAEFPQAWKSLGVRPPSSAKGKARQKTDERYCMYDEAHDDYVYTNAFVRKLIKLCVTEEGFIAVVGRHPTRKVS